MNTHAEAARRVPQIEPGEAEDRWYHVSEAIPRLSSYGQEDRSANVLVWCLKQNAVFAGQLVFEPTNVYWHTRSLDGSVLSDIQHHLTHVTHWRPVPNRPV
jgi:hypothetical protein